MSRTARLCKGAGSLTLGSLLLSGAMARAAEPPPLSRQLSELGRQALVQGETAQARTFFRKALHLDPNNAEASRALSRTAGVVRVAMQEPAAPPVPTGDEAPANAPATDPAPATEPPATDPAPATEAPAPEVPAADPAPDAAPATPAAPTVAEEPVPPEPMPVEPGLTEPAPATPREAQATLENAAELENVLRQELTNDIRQRIQRARDLVAQGQPEAALNALRLAQSVVRSADQVAEGVRTSLDRELQTHILSTIRAEERIVQDRAERLRVQASAEQQVRALGVLERNQDTISALMIQFNSLMAQGQYNVWANGGIGDVTATTAPFFNARNLAQAARALDPAHPAPRAGMFVSETMGFLAQELAYEEIKEYRYMLTLQDVARASIPFPDTQTIEYPDATRWRALSESRIKKYGRAVDLLYRDPRTQSILNKLDEPISMSFANETPLTDVLAYIRSATAGPNDTGIPIYVDPVGLQEAEITMTSPVTMDLEGVPLKTTLRLMLRQLGLSYTVKDGLLTISSETSEDLPTEIRVYPVADLAIIPISLISGGGGGGMGGGGMGGGGMGGMGGGGMGGGMGGGGMGGGMGGGFMSLPVQEPAQGFSEKKSN